MAETFVNKDQFEEFVKRMDQGFAETNRHLQNLQADIRQQRGILFGLYGFVVFGIFASAALTIFKEQLFS